jgi:hypothetical protein
MRQVVVIVMVGWFATVNYSRGESLHEEKLGGLPARLMSAKSVAEMDQIADEALGQKAAFEGGLINLLTSDSRRDQKIRACYLLGYFRAVSAVNVLGANFTLTTGPRHDIDKIPRFGPYPCLEALAYIGKPAEGKLVELLKSTADKVLRHNILDSIIYIEKRHAPAVLRDELGQAKTVEAERLREALRELGEQR